jgi:hypothetical protein
VSKKGKKTKEQKAKQERKPYMTDSRRCEIVNKAVRVHKSPGLKFMNLLPESYNKLTKIGIKLGTDQQLRHLYSSYANGNKINYVVLLLEGLGKDKYWAIWELEFSKMGEDSVATPIWKGFIKDTPFVWI